MRIVDEQSPRVETGPIKFGDDWCGLFIRGDGCGWWSHVLKLVSEGDEFNAKALAPLIELLDGTQE